MTDKQHTAKVRKAFRALVSLERKMKTHANGKNQDECYRLRVDLVKEMVSFLREDFRALTAAQLLKLCAMQSSYNPVQSFAFLVACGILQGKTDQGK